jgi:hypothetical protein
VSAVIPVHDQPGDPAPAQLAADLAALDTRIEVAVVNFGGTWTVPWASKPAPVVSLSPSQSVANQRQHRWIGTEAGEAAAEILKHLRSL